MGEIQKKLDTALELLEFGREERLSLEKSLDEATREIRDLEREQERLKAKIEALEDEIESYEQEASENLVVANVIERIELDRTHIEGEYQLKCISGQTRDVFMEHTDVYLKMLKGGI